MEAMILSLPAFVGSGLIRKKPKTKTKPRKQLKHECDTCMISSGFNHSPHVRAQEMFLGPS